jgi:hypothetical protein
MRAFWGGGRVESGYGTPESGYGIIFLSPENLEPNKILKTEKYVPTVPVPYCIGKEH